LHSVGCVFKENFDCRQLISVRQVLKDDCDVDFCVDSRFHGLDMTRLMV
jgi:hypothetical protein